MRNGCVPGERRYRRSVLARVLPCLALVTGFIAVVPAVAGPAAAQDPSLNQRFSFSGSGQILQTGNSLVECDPGPSALACSLAGGTNQDDTQTTTLPERLANTAGGSIDSSSAALIVPDGATVQKAFLYWGGAVRKSGVQAPSPSDEGKALFTVPGGAPTPVTAAAGDVRTGTTAGGIDAFQAVADVTDLVTGAPTKSGAYSVADVQLAATGGSFGGWTLVLVTSDSLRQQPVRTMKVFDGFAPLRSGADVVATAGGLSFKSSVAAPVVDLGYVGYNGSFSHADTLTFGSATPATNALQNTLSSAPNLRTPSLVTGYGYDSDLIAGVGGLTSSSTSAAARFTSSGEDAFIGAVVVQAVTDDPPVAVGDAYTAGKNGTLDVPSSGGVLANDQTNGDHVTAALVAHPAHGNVTLRPDGAFTYKPARNYVGPDSFSYKGTDGATDSAPATVNVVTDVLANPTLSTTASATVAIGGSISDSVTLAGGSSPTGTITVKVYGPNDTVCTTPAATLTAITVTGNSTYTSASFTPTTAGTYRFTAAYGGDPNNNAITETACTAANESVVVSKLTPTISTTASATVAIGGSISDSVTLAGGSSPTGTITVKVYGPNDTVCTTPAATLTAITVTGNTTYTSASFTPTTAGTYRFTAAYSGDSNNNAITETACTAANESVVVSKVTPTISTTASATVAIGGSISDSVTLAGGSSPTGTITVKVYGPNDTVCTTPAATLTAITVTGNTTYTSASFTPTTAGTYRFTAAYSGDSNNNAITETACTAANESVVVSKLTPTISTQATANVTSSGQISDAVTLAAGSSPTGTITVKVYGPNDVTCTTPVATLAPITVNAGNATYASAGFTPPSAGTYRFTASYSGDANNNAVAETACTAANESVVVPTITTQVSSTLPVSAGTAIGDNATLAGGASPTGSITFTAYGPADTTCTATPVFTDTVTVSGNSTYSSATFTPSVVGTYRFKAVYSGDANNAAVISPCNALNESVVVIKATPTISTQASVAVTIGGSISDSVTLAAGFTPTGTITVKVYGPNDTVCTTPAATLAPITVAGNGAYPSASFSPTAAGTYRFTAAYSGDVNNNAITETSCTAANESVVVSKATPTISTAASSPIVIGASISDSVTLAAGFTPTGTITVKVYGPNDTVCTTPAATLAPITVTGNSTYTSASFTPTAPGTYRFTAAYTGDTNNNAITETSCTATSESVVVSKATPTISTTASSPIVIGSTISDSVTLASGFNPTGTITVKVYGPNDTTCTTLAATLAPITVTGNTTYTSAPFSPTTAGTYRFTAAYSGDSNNNAITETSCTAANESVVVSKASPTIATQASLPVTIGNPINDTATLSGGFAPTGTITFQIFGPNNSGCTGSPVNTSTATVSGNGAYPSTPFTPTTAGTYRFVVAYGGDVNNNVVTAACNSTNESVVVGQAAPTITTQVSAATIVVGQSFTDTATIVGGSNPAGTIVFSVYGPADATCSLTPAFTSAFIPVSGNGNYPSGSIGPVLLAGTYHVIASYSGDANNGAVSTLCGDANENVVAGVITPTITSVASRSTPTGPISDTATLAGGVNPTGTITFTAFGPNDANCTSAPANVSTKPVNSGNGNYTSTAFTPPGGNYRFVVAYSGDTNNSPVTTACNDTNESVQVNAAPVAASQTVPVIEDTPATITFSATDVNADNLTFTITTAPLNGTLSTPSAPSCTVSSGTSTCTATATYTPNADFPGAAASGSDVINYKANDGTVDSNTATITIGVTQVNDVPRFTTPLSVPVAAAPASTSPQPVDLTLPAGANLRDVDDATTALVVGSVVVSPVTLPAGCTAPQPTAATTPATGPGNTTITLSGIPACFVGTIKVNYNVTDGKPNGQIAGSNTVVTEPVSGELDFVVADAQPAIQSGSLSAGCTPVGTDFACFEVTPATFSSGSTTQANLAGGQLNLDNPVGTGTSPALTDANGPTDTLALHVTGVTGATTFAGNTIDLGDNAKGCPSLPGQVCALIDAMHPHQINFQFPVGFVGTAQVSLNVTDSHGGTTGALTMTVVVPDAPPVVTTGTVDTFLNESITITPLANVADPNGDATCLVAVASPTTLNGKAVIDPTAAGTIDYTAPANIAGADTVTFVVTDGRPAATAPTGYATNPVTAVCPVTASSSAVGGQSVFDLATATPTSVLAATGQTSVTIAAAAPQVFGDPVTVLENTPTQIFSHPTDPTTGVTLFITGVTQPQHGTVTQTDKGLVVTYTPAQDYIGPDQFSYTVSDGQLESNSATVAINVIPNGTSTAADNGTGTTGTAGTSGGTGGSSGTLPQTGINYRPWVRTGTGFLLLGSLLVGLGYGRRRVVPRRSRSRPVTT